MPLFECTCDYCRKRLTVLVGMTAADALMDDLADPDKIGDMDDPQAMRRWAKDTGEGF